MKIKIYINFNPFYSTSAEGNRWLALIQGLAELGVIVDLIIIGYYQSIDEKHTFNKIKYSANINIKYFTGLIVKGIWLRRYFNYIGKRIQLIIAKKKIKKDLFGFEGIVWLENDVELWRIISGIPKKSFKLIAEMSEFLDIHHGNSGNKLQKYLGDKRQVYFESLFFNNLDGFILMTKTLINHYSAFHDPKPNLLHLPMTVDLNRFNKTIPRLENFESPYIAFVGTMSNTKDGVNILIKAFSIISNKFPEYKLYLIGSWDYDSPSHLELINGLKLERKLKYMGIYKRNEIPSIVSNASLLVLPRPDSKQARGGFPTKLGEYLASGVPVCATSVGEIPDYLTTNESVFFAKAT